MRKTQALSSTGNKDLLGALLAVVMLAISLLCVSPVIWAGDQEASLAPQQDLAQLALEDLMNIQVTSVSKKAERIADSAAAVYVVTQEDIRRSGATSIAEALRMVPGLQVTSVNSHTWAITARGFNDRFANKMLVLIDGRSVYNPLYSGTWWDVQDTMLEDVERIEVIRGPGATMWGANAVNGVINVITKRANDSQGVSLSYDTGSNGRMDSALRYGGALGANGKYRVYAKYFDRSTYVDASGNDADDAWSQTRVGFRIDRNLNDTDSLTIHSDVYNGFGQQRMRGNSFDPPYFPTIIDDYDYSGSNIVSRWTRTGSDDSEIALQLYYDRTERNDVQHSETRNTWDLDFQKRKALGENRQLMWGVGYRYTSDSIGESNYAVLDPDSTGDSLFSAFVQQDIAFPKKKLRLTVGSKLERNDYTGFELQPNVRMLWSPNDRHSLWASVSRAARTPTRVENDLEFTLRVFPPNTVPLPEGTPALPVSIQFVNNRDLDSEKLTAYEMGYRFQPANRLSLDLAAFYNDYRDLRCVNLGTPYAALSPAPHIVMPFQWANLATAQTHGLEITTNWEASQSWRLALGYTWLKSNISVDPATHDPYTANYVNYAPSNQLNLRSYLDLKNNVSLDTMFYYVDPVSAHRIPSYLRMDVRLGWRPTDGRDISLIMQNMLDSRHPEFGGTLCEVPMQIPRAVYLKYTRSY